MMIKRCLGYLGMALAMCLGSFAAHAEERISYVTVLTFGVSESYSAQAVKHDLTLSQWRTSSQSTGAQVASNLIALSNHFGQADAAPFGVPDWDRSATI